MGVVEVVTLVWLAHATAVHGSEVAWGGPWVWQKVPGVGEAVAQQEPIQGRPRGLMGGEDWLHDVCL